MRLHVPETEKALMRCAVRALDGADFQKHPVSVWRRPLSGLVAIAAASAMPAYALYITWDATTPLLLRQSVCAIAMMLLARLGAGQIAMAFVKSSFFGTLVNLPIRGRDALNFVRGIFLRMFWLPALVGSLIGALFLHDLTRPREILATWFLLTATVWTTASLAQTPWLTRFRIVKIWQFAAYFLIGAYFVLHWLGKAGGIPIMSAAAKESFFGSLLWIFPPVWVFPGKVMDGGLIPAVVWITLGAWNWLRWPATCFPDYDRPHDFLSAFGTIESADESDETDASDPAEGIIPPDPPPRPSSAGWVERLIAASIPADDRALAGTFMPDSKHSRATNLTIAFGVVWLLAMGFGKSHVPDKPYRDFFLLMSWAIPAVVSAVGLMPYAPSLKGAIQPCPVGNTPVPFFTTLPISLRSLLRLTFRITIVRTFIAVAITTPFFWLLARIHQLPEFGSGLLAMIPAIGVAWIFTVPAAISNRLDPHLQRRKGIFPLILATSLVQVPIGFLFVIASLAGIGLSFAWGMGATEGKYAVFLLPAALICLALGAAMSRLLFEILHFSLRQRRYDWKSKIR